MNISDEQGTAVAATLDNIFFSLMDEARSRLGVRPWEEVLALMALRFVGPVGESDRWVAMPFPDRTPEFFLELSRDVERQHPELEEVFTSALLSGIRRIDSHVLENWAGRLAQVSGFGVDREVFGRWLHQTMSRVALQSPERGWSTTPPSVARLIVQLASIPAGASVFDPCCGIGTILGEAIEWMSARGEKLTVFGQEISSVSWALCKLRLFFLGQGEWSVVLGDALQRPAFVEKDHLRGFDRVVCDAPMGMILRETNSDGYDQYHRFVYSPPGRGTADSAFVQHVAASLKPEGIAVLLVSHGFLFRMGGDARVREGLIRSQRVRAVIGLPAKLLPHTAIETALVVLGANQSGDIAVVDAARLQSNVRGRSELSEQTIAHILALVEPTPERRHLARLVAVAEIADNEFSLLPRRYLAPIEERRPEVNIPQLREQLRTLETSVSRASAEMDALLDQLAE